MISILAIILSPWISWSVSPQMQTKGTEAPQGLYLVEQTVYRYEPLESYQITLLFPEVIKYKPHTEHSINNQIQRIASAAMDEFQRRVANMGEGNMGARQIGINEMKLGYKVNFNDDGLLSIVFDKYVNIADAPNPYLIHLAFNYHYHRDQPLGLDDIFEDRSAARRYLNEQISLRYPKGKFSVRHLGNFAIVPDGIQIYFNNGIDGIKNMPTTFLVKWQEIDSFLQEDYKK